MRYYQKGITLLETVLASAVALIIGTFLIGILVNHNGVFYQQSSIVNEGLSLNDMISQIDGYLRQTSSVATGYPELSPTYITDSNTLVLKLPSLGPEGVVSNASDYVVITRNTTNQKILNIHIFPSIDPPSSRQAVDAVLTTILQSIEFSYLDKNGNSVAPNSASSVGVNVSVLDKTGTIGSTRSSSIVTTLRNTSQ